MKLSDLNSDVTELDTASKALVVGGNRKLSAQELEIQRWLTPSLDRDSAATDFSLLVLTPEDLSYEEGPDLTDGEELL